MKVVAGFHSALADPIRTFVEYKRALNRKYRPEAARCNCSTDTSVSTPRRSGVRSIAS
jgi:hypothetical protein